jgi:hypothetical protein
LAPEAGALPSPSHTPRSTGSAGGIDMQHAVKNINATHAITDCRGAEGANLAKPTTTQRAVDRVYWEIRWMGLMDSPAAFQCRTILLLRPKCLAGEGAFFGRRRRIVRHSFPCSNALGCVFRRLVGTSFLGSALRGGWWLRHRRPEPGPADRPGWAYRRLDCAPFPIGGLSTGEKNSKRKALKIDDGQEAQAQ